MPHNNLGELLPTDWIIGQQLGVIGYALTQFSIASRPNLNMICVNRLVTKIREFKQARVHPSTLPASTLKIFSNEALHDSLPQPLRDQFRSEWTLYDQVTRHRWDKGGASPRPSQVTAAKLVAHQILYSDARPLAIADALFVFLSEKFGDLRRDDGAMANLDREMRILRDPAKGQRNLLIAAQGVASALSRYSQSALLVRNALFDHLLAWPLLVGDLERSPVGAVSLPVAVDVSLDGAGRIDPFIPQNGKGRNSLTLRDWGDHLQRATDVGKALWRAKNGNKGAWRDEVMSSSVRFDFSIAARIANDTGFHFELSDGSMEVYFSQVVLAKLLGGQAGLSAAVSGLIGAQRTITRPRPSPEPPVVSVDSEGENALVDSEPELPPVVEEEWVLDWEFNWAEGAVAKKKFAYDSFKYDRLVLPINYKIQEIDEGEHERYIETNNCKYLSDVADCVQLGGWRQYNYIRSPDAAHSLHKYSHELPKLSEPGVAACLHMLAESTSPVMTVPEDVTARDLLSALHYINFERRLAEDRPAPSLNWTVIRATPEETDGRFWHLVYRRVFGGSHAAFDRFRFARTPAQGAAELAKCFNRRVPDEQHRSGISPDLLIVLGGKHLRNNHGADPDLFALVRPLAFENILTALNALPLSTIADERLQASLGATRIIVVEEDAPLTNSAAAEQPEVVDIKVVARLRVFRHGFTQQMASVVLGDMIQDAQALRAKLRLFQSQGLLTYGGGWYCLRPGIGEALAQSRPHKQQAIDHFYAGLAFAPYLVNRPFPGQNTAAALLPERVREAERHFEQAAWHANRHLGSHKDDRELVTIRDRSRLFQQRVMRFFDVPSWGQIRKLSRNRKGMPHEETYELAVELLERTKLAKKTPSHWELTLTARAGVQWWQKVRTHSSKKAEAERLLAEILDTFAEARRVAKVSSTLPADLVLDVDTYYAAFLRRFARDVGREELRVELDCEILNHMAAGARGYAPAGEWFGLYADGIENPVDAAHMYRMGVERVPLFFGNWVKFVGALLEFDSGAAAARALLADVPTDLLDDLLAWTIGRDRFAHEENPFRKAWVADRWKAGAAFLCRELAAPSESICVATDRAKSLGELASA